MQWLNEPKQWNTLTDGLTVRSEGQTDFWRKTHDDGIRHNGHYYFESVTGDFTASQRLKRKRESQVWGRVIDDIGKPKDGTDYVYVCDREADNFEVFCHLEQQNSGWVIRVKAKNRRLLTVQGESITLGGLLEHLTVCGHYDLTLRARPDQAARTARIEVSTGQALIPVPRQKSPWIRSR